MSDLDYTFLIRKSSLTIITFKASELNVFPLIEITLKYNRVMHMCQLHIDVSVFKRFALYLGSDYCVVFVAKANSVQALQTAELPKPMLALFV